ncbi:MAG: FkbM family methyltransferase [Hyphomicrobiaceae bacterium]|nr:FkbM family methyltransferase [Hyphomicrobiaceae bacterium]
MLFWPRRIAEDLFRDWTVRRRLPAEFGSSPILMSSAGGLGAIFKPVDKYDPTLLQLAKDLVKPGSTVWDIGANIGLFSVAAAARAGASGSIFSFEPDVVLVKLLRRTAGLQSESSARLTIVPVAVAADFGLRSFNIARRARASNYLAEYGNSQTGGIAEAQTVMAVSVDKLATWLPKPDLLKIDVEGAELEVLQGAKLMLAEARPIVVCEVSGRNAGSVSQLLTCADYVLFDGGKPLSREAIRLDAAWCTVAVPSEGVDRISGSSVP